MQPSGSRRAHKLGDQIMRIVAQLLATEIDDQRLAMVSVSGVRMNKDISIAEVLYSVPMGSDPVEIEAAFKKSAGFFRSQVGRALKSKYVPKIIFKRDDFLEEMVYGQPDQGH
ncbi:30S ribosome-binding factor RbfA [Desulfovibrio ferrophilus]|uniref:Ribosome-binding factor A n=1 Tax=Desulfovibrio ferrophilus TaxID=241368 RepID=A0A2Z6AXH6_9BACT|nr:30S ribosome-binding factor RbfA [Desulfovibrio ferrophilus]BBD07920.1 ribosome-binding factor A [Desulfovibrio ferrophilus]